MKNKPVKNKPASITYEISCLHSGVTGSSIILMIHFPNGDTRHILIDCGMYQEFEYNKYNFDFPTQFPQVYRAEFIIQWHQHLTKTAQFSWLFSRTIVRFILTNIGIRLFFELVMG